jgi:parallel beta-helix repeat protein
LSGNIVKSNADTGIMIKSSSSNNIYNNFFENTNNVYLEGIIYNKNWNTTKTTGINIIGGSYLGGNFWANPSDTGFSQKCEDVDVDGICDSPYTLDSNNIDYLPLTYNLNIDGFGNYVFYF